MQCDRAITLCTYLLNYACVWVTFDLPGMELFASCLWHLRCDVELSVVTETLLTSDPCRVEGLCAKATSLNLVRDHEAAVKCLQKAIAVSQSLSLALGHQLHL